MLNNQTITNPPDGGQTPPSGEPPQGQTPSPATTTPSGSQQQQQQQHVSYQQQTSIDSLPPDIQDYIQRLRSENAEANKKAKAEATAKQQAEEARLKEQGEWKSLAEQHEAKVKELEPIATRYQELATQLSKQIDTEIKDWPPSVKALDPGKDAPIEQRIAWRNQALAIIAELQGQGGRVPGNGPNPRSAGQQSVTNQHVEELGNRWQQRHGKPF